MVATTRLLEGFAHDARGKDRRAVIDLAHRLIQALETPADILRRIGFSVRVKRLPSFDVLTKTTSAPGARHCSPGG